MIVNKNQMFLVILMCMGILYFKAVLTDGNFRQYRVIARSNTDLGSGGTGKVPNDIVEVREVQLSGRLGGRGKNINKRVSLTNIQSRGGGGVEVQGTGKNPNKRAAFQNTQRYSAVQGKRIR